MSKTKYVTLRVPADDWDTLWETLECDSRSSAFDKDLREEISEAMQEVQVVQPPQLILIIEGGVVQQVLSDSPDVSVHLIDYDTDGMDGPNLRTLEDGEASCSEFTVGHEPKVVKELLETINREDARNE